MGSEMCIRDRPYLITTIIFAILFIIGLGFFIASFKTIGLNQTGMLQNKFSKEIETTHIYKNGRYFIGPFNK